MSVRNGLLISGGILAAAFAAATGYAYFGLDGADTAQRLQDAATVGGLTTAGGALGAVASIVLGNAGVMAAKDWAQKHTKALSAVMAFSYVATIPAGAFFGHLYGESLVGTDTVTEPAVQEEVVTEPVQTGMTAPGNTFKVVIPA